jgi:hypothetical protein
MSQGTRIVLAAIAVCASAFLLTAAAGAVYVYQDGMIDVAVHEKQPGGSSIHIVVPTALARLALAFVPTPRGIDTCPDARRYWPAVEALLAGIAKAPDGILVQVDGRDEHVTVRKSGDRLVVDVDDRDAKVRVSIPVRAGDLRRAEVASRLGGHERGDAGGGRARRCVWGGAAGRRPSSRVYALASDSARLTAASMPALSRMRRTSAFCFGRSCRMKPM